MRFFLGRLFIVLAFSHDISPVHFEPLCFLDPVADAAVALVVLAFVPLAASLPVSAVLVSAVFVPLAASLPASAVLVSAVFVPLVASLPVSAVLVSAAHIPLVVSFSSHYPS